MLSVLLLLIMFLPGEALAISCITFRDCPVRDCAGTARLCESNICQDTQCIVPAASDIRQIDVETFGEAVKPYEAGINLSEKTKNPSLIQNNMLASLGIQGILMLLLKGMVVLFIALAAALFFVFAKEKGILGIVLVVFGVTIVAVAGFAVISGKGGLQEAFGRGHTWNSASAKDFVASYARETGLETVQNDYLSPRLIAARDYKIDTENSETDVMVLEMDSAAYLSSLRIGSLSGDKITIAGEHVLRQDSGSAIRYIFDEDRFVFIVTAKKDDIDRISEGIIGRYPGEPTESRLFAEDLIPPEISGLTPGTAQITNNDRLSFTVTDAGSGVDASTIRVKNLAGLTTESCKTAEGGYQCSFTPKEPHQGEVDFEIWASDKAGNPKKLQGNFIFDSSPAELEMLSPEDNGYTNSRRVSFLVADSVSGIASLEIDGALPDSQTCNKTKLYWKCSIETNPAEGEKTLLVYAQDNAGNSRVLHSTYHYDTVPPRITAGDYSFDITDSSPLAAIRVNGENFPASDCTREDIVHHCMSEEKIDTVYAEDMAGNSAEAS